MAEIVSSLINGSQVKVVYSYTQNIAANTSTILATLWVHRDSYGPSYDSSCSAYININGSRAMTYTSSFTIGSSWVQIGSTGSMTVAHNSDGTKVCNITGYFSSSVTSKLTDLSVSQSVTLTTIPRASTLTTTPSVTIGDSFAYGINRASSDFTHSIDVFVSMSETSGYSKIKTITGIGTGGTCSFNDAEIQAMFSVVNAGNTGYLQLQLYTYSGSTQIGSYTWTRGRCYTAAPSQPSMITYPNTTQDWNIGDSVTIHMNRARTDYTHTVSVLFGTWGSTVGTGVTDNVAWVTANNASSLYAQIPNANSGIGTVTVTTYSHGANIGSRSVGFTTHVVNSNPTFSGFTYKDVNATSVAVSGNSALVIQNVSSVQVTVNGASAKNSAAISSYKVQYGAKSLSSSSNVITFGTLPGNDSFIVTVIDSRGNSTQQSLSVPVIPYAAPLITAVTLTRVNDIEAGTVLSCAGAYAHCMITSGHYALKYRYKATNSSTWNDYVGITPILSGDNFTFSANIGNFDISTSYNFEVVPYDYFYSNTATGFLSTSKPLLSLRDGQIGVNKIPQSGAFDVDGDIYQSGSKVHSDAYHPIASRLISAYMARQVNGNTPVSADTVNTVELMQATSTMTTNKPPTGDGPMLTFHWDNTGGWDSQLAASGQTGSLSVRGMISSIWQAWKKVFDDSYHPQADCSAKLYQGANTASTQMIFNWAGQGGQPSWLWGGNDGTNMYVWNPSNFSVAQAVRLGTPQYIWTGSIAANASVTLTHNLNSVYTIVSIQGTTGNLNVRWKANDGNNTYIYNYNTGSNTWSGSVYIWL